MKRATLILLVSASLAAPHPHAGALIAVAQTPAPTAVVSGQGDFRYEYVPGKLELPAGVQMKHGHGLCRDADGNIYFTFEPQKAEAQTQALVRFTPDGTGAVLLGDPKLATGVPHGLNIHTEKDGQTYLDHANNAATVHKTTLDGKIVWTQTWPAQMGNYKPTDVVVPPGSSREFVADGYGSSMIHALRTKDGVYDGKSWGGTGKAHGELHTPHAITFDQRRQLLLIADRSNKRLDYYTLSGQYQSTIEAKEITAPCNADIWGDYALIPDLNGPVVILDKDNKVISIIEIGKLLGSQGHKHPHDAIWLANGDVVICTWNPGRLSYWRRLPAPNVR
jgi:hypothetical protein